MMGSAGGCWWTYSNLCSQMVSASCNSCHSKNPYHKHCGCSLHDSHCKFEGTPSNKHQVKVPNKKARSHLYRSLSVQNLADRGGLSTSSSSSSMSSLAGSDREMSSPFTGSSFGSGEEEQLADESSSSSCEASEKDESLTVAMIEGLVTVIQTAEEFESDANVGPEEICGIDGDGAMPALERDQFLAYRSSMFHSETNLCGYTRLDANLGTVSGAVCDE